MSRQNGKELRFNPILQRLGFSEVDISDYWQKFYHSSMKYDARHAARWIEDRVGSDYEGMESEIEPTLEEQHENSGSNTMSINHKITALQNFNTVGCRFDDTRKIYTYKTSENFEVGDKAIVCPNGSLKVVQIVRVDDTPQIEFGSNVEYKWIVQKIDLDSYNDRLEREEKMSVFIRQAIANKQREEVSAALEAVIGLSAVTELKALLSAPES